MKHTFGFIMGSFSLLLRSEIFVDNIVAWIIQGGVLSLLIYWTFQMFNEYKITKKKLTLYMFLVEGTLVVIMSVIILVQIL